MNRYATILCAGSIVAALAGCSGDDALAERNDKVVENERAHHGFVAGTLGVPACTQPHGARNRTERDALTDL